ncbi:hypothetical protein BCR35DRAFT_144969 [Leucosporidium creatinivorum]|uniref:F-box domain-containing protein n=1 Tax=Leucosporidium creatinivorum TaxID=106004 RepID=A0A1Y2EQK0_9BASI|nr:hypothetical protein BCR35DRAFT_144969 [Leucosporidium creatinivorum]
MVRALPTEIVHHIIILSLPEETTYATYKDRYRSLLAYSLVDSKWRTLAQKELYSVLYVTESKYLKSGLLAKAQSLGGGRRLHLGVPESQWRRRDYSDAEAELPSLDGVKEVILTDLRLSEEDLMKLTGEFCDLGARLRRVDPSSLQTSKRSISTTASSAPMTTRTTVPGTLRLVSPSLPPHLPAPPHSFPPRRSTLPQHLPSVDSMALAIQPTSSTTPLHRAGGHHRRHSRVGHRRARLSQLASTDRSSTQVAINPDPRHNLQRYSRLPLAVFHLPTTPLFVPFFRTTDHQRPPLGCTRATPVGHHLAPYRPPLCRRDLQNQSYVRQDTHYTHGTRARGRRRRMGLGGFEEFSCVGAREGSG